MPNSKVLKSPLYSVNKHYHCEATASNKTTDPKQTHYPDQESEDSGGNPNTAVAQHQPSDGNVPHRPLHPSPIPGGFCLLTFFGSVMFLQGLACHWS